MVGLIAVFVSVHASVVVPVAGDAAARAGRAAVLAADHAAAARAGPVGADDDAVQRRLRPHRLILGLRPAVRFDD